MAFDLIQQDVSNFKNQLAQILQKSNFKEDHSSHKQLYSEISSKLLDLQLSHEDSTRALNLQKDLRHRLQLEHDTDLKRLQADKESEQLAYADRMEK